MTTPLDLQAKISLAIQANEAGDTSTALTYLESAEMILVALPYLTQDRVRVEYQNQITEIRKRLTAKQNVAGGLVQIPFVVDRCGR